jgi:hypothetical protein
MMQNAIQAVLDNKDPTRKVMLMMSVREARDMLSLRAQEVGPSDADSIALAVGDVHVLLNTIDEQFGY